MENQDKTNKRGAKEQSIKDKTCYNNTRDWEGGRVLELTIETELQL